MSGNTLEGMDSGLGPNSQVTKTWQTRQWSRQELIKDGASLKGKVCVVTGAASGIGKAFCLHAASFGAAVVCADLNEQGAQETASLCIQKGGQAVGVACNVTDHAALVNIFDVALKKFGKLDVVCPCAGVASVDSNYAKGAPELLQRPAFLTLQINLIAVVDSVSIALHHWKKVQPSTPVNILLVGSMSSFIAFKSEPLYVAAKHGVLGLARALYLDYKTEQKIRVCMIAPWFVDTGIIPKIAKAAIAAVGFAEMEDVTSAMIAGATSVGDGQSYAIDTAGVGSISLDLDQEYMTPGSIYYVLNKRAEYAEGRVRAAIRIYRAVGPAIFLVPLAGIVASIAVTLRALRII